MTHPRAESPSPHPLGRPEEHGANAIQRALERFEFPMTTIELAQCAGDVAFSFRRGQTVRVRDTVGRLPERRFETIDEAVAALVGLLDERRAVDRRVAPPHFGAADRLPD